MFSLRELRAGHAAGDVDDEHNALWRNIDLRRRKEVHEVAVDDHQLAGIVRSLDVIK